VPGPPEWRKDLIRQRFFIFSRSGMGPKPARRAISAEHAGGQSLPSEGEVRTRKRQETC